MPRSLPRLVLAVMAVALVTGSVVPASAGPAPRNRAERVARFKGQQGTRSLTATPSRTRGGGSMLARVRAGGGAFRPGQAGGAAQASKKTSKLRRPGRPGGPLLKPAAPAKGPGLSLRRLGGAALARVKRAATLDPGVGGVADRARMLVAQGSLAEAARALGDIPAGAKLSARDKVTVALARRAVVSTSIRMIGERADAGDLEGARDALAALDHVRQSGKLGVIARARTWLHQRAAKHRGVNFARRMIRMGDIEGALRHVEVADGLGGGISTRLAARALAKTSSKLAKRMAKSGDPEGALYAMDLASVAAAHGQKASSERALFDDGLEVAQHIARGGDGERALALVGMAVAAGDRGGLAGGKVEAKTARALVRIGDLLHRAGNLDHAADALALAERVDGKRHLRRGDRNLMKKVAQRIGARRMGDARVALARAAEAPDDEVEAGDEVAAGGGGAGNAF